MRRNPLLAAVLVILCSQAGTAQELPKAAKYENVTWATAVDVQFKAGQADEALEIVHNHLKPAADAVGWNVLVLEYQTGEWNARYVFPLADGPAGLEWNVSPAAEEWWAALAEREGGAEAAFNMFQSYQAMVARSQSNVLMQRQ
ncbi:MAG: hypothetical protein ACE5JR_13610 [Gemmatimonadota bacterium]